MRIPVGFIEWRVQTDKYNNDVSLIRMCDGGVFRMVHHSQKFHRTQYATIYHSRGKFVKVEYNSTDNPCAEIYCKVGGYRVAWGDGDNLGVKSDPNGPDLKDLLSQILDDNHELVIVNVLAYIEHVDAAWSRKEVLARA